MVNLENVREARKAALESLWCDRCTVYAKEKVTDPKTHLTDFQETVILENQPCKLSFETLAAVSGDPVAAVSQSVKLFLSPDVEIPAGCKIVVTRPGGAQLSYSKPVHAALIVATQQTFHIEFDKILCLFLRG